MTKEDSYRPRKVTPPGFKEEEQVPVMDQESPLNQVQEHQKKMGMEVPVVEGEMGIKGPVPAAMRQYMVDTNQPKRGPQTRPTPSFASPFAGGANSDTVKEILAATKGFVDNYEEIVLPSMGKFYDGQNGPIDGKIHVRPMTGNDEKILATPRFVKKGQAVNMIFKNCMAEKFNPEELLTIDRTYLLIFLRGISYTPDYEVEIKCTECSSKFQTTINLDTLWCDHCPEDFSEESLTDVLPATGFRFKYRLSKGCDETVIQEHRERRIKNFGDNAHDDTLLFRASLLIDWIESPSGQLLTGQALIQTVLEQLPIKDVAYIRNLLTDPPFGVDTKVTLTCPSCNNEFSSDLPLEANFFFPRTRKQKAMPA